MLRNLMLAAVMLFAVSCRNPELTAYKLTGTTVTLVDGAMNGWGDWVRAGRATAGDQAKVEAAYIKYQSAILTEKLAVLSYKQSPTNEPSLNVALDMVSAASGQLVALVNQLVNQK